MFVTLNPDQNRVAQHHHPKVSTSFILGRRRLMSSPNLKSLLLVLDLQGERNFIPREITKQFQKSSKTLGNVLAVLSDGTTH